jgi:chemotaxis response regulator CheB
MDILQATDEREAFQKINTLLPDVIFIDLGLPMEDRTASQ